MQHQNQAILGALLDIHVWTKRRQHSKLLATKNFQSKSVRKTPLDNKNAAIVHLKSALKTTPLLQATIQHPEIALTTEKKPTKRSQKATQFSLLITNISNQTLAIAETHPQSLAAESQLLQNIIAACYKAQGLSQTVNLQPFNWPISPSMTDDENARQALLGLMLAQQNRGIRQFLLMTQQVHHLIDPTQQWHLFEKNTLSSNRVAYRIPSLSDLIIDVTQKKQLWQWLQFNLFK